MTNILHLLLLNLLIREYLTFESSTKIYVYVCLFIILAIIHILMLSIVDNINKKLIVINNNIIFKGINIINFYNEALSENLALKNVMRKLEIAFLLIKIEIDLNTQNIINNHLLNYIKFKYINLFDNYIKNFYKENKFIYLKKNKIRYTNILQLFI